MRAWTPALRQSLITRLTLTTENGYLTRHHRGPSAAFRNMEEKLSFIQRLISHLPGNWASDMEAESRKWIARCRECGSEKSLWDHGGIRWKAAGSPSTRLACDTCGRITWQQLNYRDSK